MGDAAGADPADAARRAKPPLDRLVRQSYQSRRFHSAEGLVLMPLVRSSDRFRADFDGIYFRMKDGKKNITCLVSYEALDDYVHGTQTRRERVSIFKQSRLRFDRAASAKYDRGAAELDGSVRVGARDLNPDQLTGAAA
jgi:Protein of unknown function (DUF1488)